MTTRDGSRIKGSGYELFMLMTSVLSMFNVGLILLRPSAIGQEVAMTIEVLLTPLFAFDFLYRLASAPSRTGYFVRDWGWADLVAIAPLLRVFRIPRIVGVVRHARAAGGRRIVRDLLATRASAVFFLTMFLVILVVEFAGIAVYYTERGDPAANITTASDAIWWGLVTITTVGYGDQYPVTQAGRLVGTFLLFSGIALFSVLTGFIANAFLAPRGATRRDMAPGPGSVAAELDELRRLLVVQEEHAAAIRHKLEDLEQALETDAEPPPA